MVINKNIMENNLKKNEANYAPLSPISFLIRSANIWPDKIAWVHGNKNNTYKQLLDRCSSIASGIKNNGELEAFAGDSYILFSSGARNNIFAPIPVYCSAFLDFINLNWIDSAPIFVINEQFNRWIQPQEIHYIVTFLIIFILLIQKNNFIVKTMCLLALSQHFVLLIFAPDNRYAYLAWILTIILNFYFIINIVLKPKSINKIKKIMFR